MSCAAWWTEFGTALKHACTGLMSNVTAIAQTRVSDAATGPGQNRGSHMVVACEHCFAAYHIERAAAQVPVVNHAAACACSNTASLCVGRAQCDQLCRQHLIKAAGLQSGRLTGGELVSLLCLTGTQIGAALGQLLGSGSAGPRPHISVERRQPTPVPAQPSQLSPPELDAHNNAAHGAYLCTVCGVLLVQHNRAGTASGARCSKALPVQTNSLIAICTSLDTVQAHGMQALLREESQRQSTTVIKKQILCCRPSGKGLRTCIITGSTS